MSLKVTTIVLALVCCPVTALGYGAIAVSKQGDGTPNWVAAFNAKTVAEAQETALKQCVARGGPCEVLTLFVNDCVSLFKRQPNVIDSVSAAAPNDARQLAASQCPGREASCVIDHAPICDRIETPAKLVPTYTIVPPKVLADFQAPPSMRERVLAFIHAYAVEVVVISITVTLAALVFAATAVFAAHPPRDE